MNDHIKDVVKELRAQIAIREDGIKRLRAAIKALEATDQTTDNPVKKVRRKRKTDIEAVIAKMAAAPNGA